MCSVDDSDKDCMVKKEKVILNGANCRKCAERKASIVLHGKFPYCRECFLTYFCHKYDGGLGKSKMMKMADRVLVAFSGSPSSVCLLQLIKASMAEEKRKKIKFDITIIYIDDMIYSSCNERSSVYTTLRKHINKYSGHKLHFTLIDVKNDIILFNEFDPQKEYCNFNDNFKILLEKITSKTSKIDFLKKLKYNILVKAAHQLDCNKIFTAETSDHVASNFLSDIALGRGKHLSQNIGFSSCSDGDPTIIRPLINCSKKEVICYNIFNKLDFLVTPIDIDIDKLSSIQKMTEHFITDLQCSYPSTVTTVVSTGKKMDSDGADENTSHCLLCQASVETEENELSASQAVRISSLVSRLGPNHLDTNHFQPNADTNSLLSRSNDETDSLPKSSHELLFESLCYGCRLIVKDSNSVTVWRNFIGKVEDKIFTRMHNEVQDYFL